jgi:hypothetical protein
MVRSSSLSAERVLLLGPLQVSHPAGDGPPDLVRRIFLEEVEPRDRYLRLRWQGAGEVEICTCSPLLRLRSRRFVCRLPVRRPRGSTNSPKACI